MGSDADEPHDSVPPIGPGTAGEDPGASVSALLSAVAAGDRGALNDLIGLVYEELTHLARRQRKRWDGDLTLNTTALVHEVYLKLAGQQHLVPESRAHLFAVAATAMRHVLCNYARDRRRKKRGGGAAAVSLESGTEIPLGSDFMGAHADQLMQLEDSLRRFEQVAPRQAKVVECRFFGGMSVEDTAAALSLSPRSVKRDWQFARAWLQRELLDRDGRGLND